MKLRNKKTGEIVEPRKIGFEIYSFNEWECNSLAELNAEWEDYEEPKEYGLDNIIALVEVYSDNDSERYPKEIVEKLKAWKRLKDKDFQFHGYSALGCGEITFSLDFEDMDDEGEIGELQHDLELLFGGEE